MDFGKPSNVLRENREDDIPATTDLHKTYKFPDFHVNYIILDFLFQGATDEPTEAEKLAKLGTLNITSEGTGKWGTDIDIDDLYYEYLMRLENGQPSFLIGDGGGDDDFHGMRMILDSGLGKYSNTKFGWASDLNAKLKIKYIADSGLDNSKIRIEFVGQNEARPTHVTAIENLETTYGAKGDLAKFTIGSSEKLQEAFGFLTTELNLATIQDITVFGIQTMELRPNDQENEKVILGHVNQMVDGINDGGEGLIQQYFRKTFDPMLQGQGYGLIKDDVVAFKAGVAEATRLYLRKIQPVTRI